ncbi:neuronal membrane glycoprotein M6-a-like [Centruroides sculpturatus]|uniref:neuronal membrane glycoprotein M6-a-like n=1 Tax=Centruroides sculpturatus TaxID=218467 RepID=UPI000C6DB829|nr:neuronal membrane glycoprotein M6-a-like [Centruroides sculpturatus]XP_023238308.1 neuronal membrane glycoprotein M6-a-like [Centruroides sculpturatus]
MGKCMKCLLRVPYATLIATILCCASAGVFMGALYKIMSLSLRMLENHFAFHFNWLKDLHIVFIAAGAVMGLISLVMLIVGILATGSTRSKVYRGWRARLGGRISCAVFMAITYVLELAWILIVVCMAVVSFVFYILAHLCNNSKPGEGNDGVIDLSQFNFLFPKDTNVDKLKFTEENGDRTKLCIQMVEPSLKLVILSLIASILVVLSLVHYLMCLSANYARIKDHEKLRDLQELQYLQDTDPGTMPRDRF